MNIPLPTLFISSESGTIWDDCKKLTAVPAIFANVPIEVALLCSLLLNHSAANLGGTFKIYPTAKAPTICPAITKGKPFLEQPAKCKQLATALILAAMITVVLNPIFVMK